MMDRRGLLVGLAAGSGALSLNSLVHAGCLLTAQQVEGPFYPIEIGEQDRDLTHVAGGVSRALGEVVEISGKVIDERCNPVGGAMLEIWQANSMGRYFHPRDYQGDRPLDPNFQGYARLRTDEKGRYGFITVKPGSYEAMGSWVRPPHIHFCVRAPGNSSFTTQMYFAEEPLNETDYILQKLDLTQRRGLIVSLHKTRADGVKGGEFDLVVH
jgi:protocatechuate 3,4-dioxygenase beta subunit